MEVWQLLNTATTQIPEIMTNGKALDKLAWYPHRLQILANTIVCSSRSRVRLSHFPPPASISLFSPRIFWSRVTNCVNYIWNNRWTSNDIQGLSESQLSQAKGNDSTLKHALSPKEQHINIVFAKQCASFTHGIEPITLNKKCSIKTLSKI